MPTISEDAVNAFSQLFRGLDKAYGGTEGNSIKEAPTTAIFRAHLEGKRPIGIYPLRSDGTVYFAAIDFDRLKDYQTGEERPPEDVDALALADAEAVRRVLHDMGIVYGIFLERSKSKGSHLWWLFDQPAPACDVRHVLQYVYDTAIGRRPTDPKVEIFPKQDSIPHSRDGKEQFGNYINLPYFGTKPGQTRRVMLDRDTTGAYHPMSLDAFLHITTGEDGAVFSTEHLAGIVEKLPKREESPKPPPSSGPLQDRRKRLYPCTLPMLAAGLHEHTGRNQFGFLLSKRLHVGGFDNDEGRNFFDGWNVRNSPPLEPRELSTLWDQGGKYSSMGCDDPLVEPYCKTSCPLHPLNTTFEYSRLRKELTEPPRYMLTINGCEVRIESFAKLNDHRHVSLMTGEQHDWMPDPMKPAKWGEKIRDLLRQLETEQVPAEATTSGLVWSDILTFLARRTDDDTTPPSRTPVERDDWVLFNGRDLLKDLEMNRSLKVKLGDVWAVIAGHGGISTVRRFNNKNYRVWALPLASLMSSDNADNGDQV